MRKTMIVAVLALLSSTAVCAQERMSQEEREKAIAERIERAADRVAGDFKLKDDAKKSEVKSDAKKAEAKADTKKAEVKKGK